MREAILKSDTPRNAYYRIRIEELAHGQGYVVRKQSGVGDRIKNTEAWYRDGFEAALKWYEAKIKLQTDTGRKRVLTVEAKWTAPF